MIKSLDLDIVCLCETFFRGTETLNINGYKCFHRNRNELNRNCQAPRRGSGGVAILVKNDLLTQYKFEILDDNTQDILWLKMSGATETMCICVCYLPPENSVYHDALQFYTTLLEQVYAYQNMGDKMYICGDMNSRCGESQDFIEGVDDIQIREILDDKSNRNGDLLIDFLVDCNMCMVNGRVGTQDFTNISNIGKSVVDYVLVPHEQLCNVLDFKVKTVTDLVSELDLTGYESMPDHSLLQCTIGIMPRMSDSDGNTVNAIDNGIRRAPRRFLINSDSINPPFLNNSVREQVEATLNRIQAGIENRQRVDNIYSDFKQLVISEMETNYKEIRATHTTSHRKSNLKPYWNDDLQRLWDNVRNSERDWKKSKSRVKGRLYSVFLSTRREFDRVNRKHKRKYQLSQQERLQNLGAQHNTRDFWKHIGKLGLVNDRKKDHVYSIRDEDENVTSDMHKVLDKWKVDYSHLYNSADSDYDYDDEFLDNIRLQMTSGERFPNNIDISDLNAEIERTEVRDAVYRAKLNKAVGIDEIPSEMLRNDACVDLLYNIIKYCFQEGQVPQEWLTSVITPIPKPKTDPLDPLTFRPISLISVPCKIYADILNKRLSSWLERNDILSEEQNGFRKKRSCLDHLYVLTSIVKNRKIRKKDTYVCFIDAKRRLIMLTGTFCGSSSCAWELPDHSLMLLSHYMMRPKAR